MYRGVPHTVYFIKLELDCSFAYPKSAILNSKF